MGSCVPVRVRAACAVGCEEKFWAPGPPVSFGPLGIATDHALELTVSHWPVTKAELQTFERATVAWPRDPQGYHLGDGFLKLPARDLAKLGYLYLNDGRWDGTQVVPADYVRASTQPQSDPDTGDHYGYQWWVNDAYRYDAFRAQGYGGQLIYGIPKLHLVVVTPQAGPSRSHHKRPRPRASC